MGEPADGETRVQEALAHLYDVAFLERSPLGEALGLPRRRGAGAALHRRLLETIERLKPPRDVAAESVAWKIYRALHLRYVRSLSVAAVANELGLSTRQTQRVHAAAVAAVAATLGEAGWAEDGGGPREADPPLMEAANPPLDALLDDEIAAILARDHAEEEPLPAIIRSAIQTITPMLEARGASVELATDDALATRVAPHDLVRPAIVQLLLAALDHAQPRAMGVAAALDGAGVVVRLATAPREVGSDGTDAAADLERRLGVARRLLGAIGGAVAIELTPVFRIEARLPAGIAPTVLVVEDNPQVVQLFRRYLSGSPYQMLSAATGSVALDLASAERPDAITLDLLLPQRDGWEFLQAAKVHPATRDIPVIVCSVLRERELALSLGAADFLAKPVTQHALLTALRQHLRRSPPADLAPSATC